MMNAILLRLGTVLAIGTLFFSQVIHAAALTDTINRLTPETCRPRCQTWTNNTMPCIEQAGTLGFTYDPVSGDVTFQGNKLALYFCLCSSGAIANSGQCLSCLSEKYNVEPAMDSDTYRDLCTGNLDLTELMQRFKR
jgi:hypothetical protein